MTSEWAVGGEGFGFISETEFLGLRGSGVGVDGERSWFTSPSGGSGQMIRAAWEGKRLIITITGLTRPSRTCWGRTVLSTARTLSHVFFTTNL